jgi:hypothetical protein
MQKHIITHKGYWVRASWQPDSLLTKVAVYRGPMPPSQLDAAFSQLSHIEAASLKAAKRIGRAMWPL